MQKLIPVLFYSLAVIHILPALSGLSSSRLASLYGISADDKTLMTLLQHRAVLFGLVAHRLLFVDAVAKWGADVRRPLPPV